MRRDGYVGVSGPRVYRSMALTAGSGVVFLALLAGQLGAVDVSRILAAMGQVGLLPWLAAALATVLSFQAAAGYDLALHRHLATGIAPARARRAGFAAIAIGQTVGMGVLSGTLVRWRLLPEIGLLGAARLSLLVAVSFLASWMVLTALVLCFLPAAPLAALAPLGLAIFAVSIFLSLAFPRPWMPNLRAWAGLLALAAADCGAAALALWWLLPVGVDPAAFGVAFLLALGAGLVSSSPSGLGAFELVFLALLPAIPHEPLLAGVLAWRGIYFALPALVGAAVALLARSEAEPAPPALSAPAIAEAGLAAQGTFRIYPEGFLAARTSHGLVALAEVADPGQFRAAARDQGCWPVLYKAGPRMALRARAAGFTVVPVAREAWLRPATFRLDVPARAGLRRKLRRAAAAGVTAAVESCPDWDRLGPVNAAWRSARGGEYGFSMGRYDPDYCAQQTVIVARRAGEVLGFATFHVARIAGDAVWTLDLLRPAPFAPEGTAQLMVHAALEAARSAGAVRLSLAAVPLGGAPDERGIIARLGRWLAPSAAQGLAQFKAAFAPNWTRLYIAGPSGPVLALVGWEIWRSVRRPSQTGSRTQTAHEAPEYEFASARNPWQRGEDSLV